MTTPLSKTQVVVIIVMILLGVVLLTIEAKQSYDCYCWLNQPIPNGTEWKDVPTLMETYPRTPICEFQIGLINSDPRVVTPFKHDPYEKSEVEK